MDAEGTAKTKDKAARKLSSEHIGELFDLVEEWDVPIDIVRGKPCDC